MGKPRGSPPQTKINVTSKSPVGDISVVTLIRTDTTLDHSQKAEKVCSTYARRTHPSSIVQSTWFSRRGTQRQQRRAHTHTHTHDHPVRADRSGVPKPILGLEWAQPRPTQRRYMRQNTQNTKEDWSCAAYPPQRSLRAALGCCPTTAGGAQFCLLCCQPGPVPESLPARPPTLTQGRPCRPPVWLGHPIHTASRTCDGPQRFISQVPMRGTGRHDPPQRSCMLPRAIMKHVWVRRHRAAVITTGVLHRLVAAAAPPGAATERYASHRARVERRAASCHCGPG